MIPLSLGQLSSRGEKSLAELEYTYEIDNASTPAQAEVEQNFDDADTVVGGGLDETNFYKDAIVSTLPVRTTLDISSIVWAGLPHSPAPYTPYIKFRPSFRTAFVTHMAFAYQTYTSGQGVALSVNGAEKIVVNDISGLPNTFFYRDTSSRIVPGDIISAAEPVAGGALTASGIGIEIGISGMMPT